MGVAGTRQRNLLSDHGAKRACGGIGQCSGRQSPQLAGAGARAANLRDTAIGKVLLADRREAPGRHAERAQTPTGPQQLEGIAANRAADAVKDDIDAPAVHRGRHLIRPPAVAVVHGHIGPHRARHLELVLTAGRGDDERPGALGELHQQRSDAARRGLNQHRRSGFERHPVHQPDRGPTIGQQRRCVRERELVGNRDQPVGRDRHQPGVTAGPAGRRDDPRPNHLVADPWSHGLDDSGHAVSGNRRQLRQHRGIRSPSPADLRLDEGHARKRNLDQHFARSAPGVRDVAQHEYLGRAEFLHHYRLHARRSDLDTRAIVLDRSPKHNPQLGLRPQLPARWLRVNQCHKS